MRYLEYERASWITSQRKHNYFTRLAKNNNIICLQESDGKLQLLQAIQVLVPQFRLCGTLILNDLNAGGSAICIRKCLSPDGTMVTHVVTCQGRDHTVNVRSGDPPVTPHWPLCPEALGMFSEEDTEQPRSQAPDCFDCITSAQKQALRYADALL